MSSDNLLAVHKRSCGFPLTLPTKTQHSTRIKKISNISHRMRNTINCNEDMGTKKIILHNLTISVLCKHYADKWIEARKRTKFSFFPS